MVIVDTSIWVTHFRQGSRRLEKLLVDAEVMCHPFIIGELACGNLKNRQEIISLLQSLPMAQTVEFDEFLFFIDRNHLMGKGVGFVDVHLLASAQLTGAPLWTADKRLKSAAGQLELTFT
jgi:predicted nucleic acid-binding protein